MIDENDTETFVGPEPKSSIGILSALKKAEDAFTEWQATCQTIDEIYNLDGAGYGGVRADLDDYGWSDAKLDMFWASYEVLKPAVYARPPVPVVAPMFKDSKRLPNVTAELLERCSVSTLKRTGIDDIMTHVRDDLIFTSRGVMWLTYEADKDGKRVCFEHLDRRDFLHEPCRKWSEVGWVARRAWMTRKEMRKRFYKTSGDAYKGAQFVHERERDDAYAEEARAVAKKAAVWEVWHKADNKVYWVTEGVDKMLDSGAPHLELEGFFPCPRPAYATKRRRSLIPVPDWQRYAIHFRKISDLTGRIYLLLDKVRMKGLIPAGGDVGDAVEELIKADDDEILIPVPSGAMLQQGANGFVAWLPLKELAEAIQGLITARAQLIDDFYQLSGISDIMRGATEEDETLGAQQLKTQFGSVRVREKSSELQRMAADAVKIAAEIIAEKFDADTLLAMSGMEIPTKAELAKRIKDIESAARQEIEALGQTMREMQGDPAQAKQAMQQAQQQVLARYAPMLAEVEESPPIEDVVKLLRDERTRCYTFEIESSSTILTDELEEKRSRNEFMEAFSRGSQSLMSLAAMGEQGAKLAGAMMKFVLAPYRAGRELDGMIDQFIDAAPQMAAAAAGKEGDSEALIEANNKLAEAEQMKAQAAMAQVQARSQLDKAEMQRKVAEMQQKAMEAERKAENERAKLELQIADMATKADQAQRKLEAEIDKIRAETVKILSDIGLAQRQQEMNEFTSVKDVELREGDQAINAQGQAQDAQFREREGERADRQQDFAESTTDREMSFNERQAERTDNG